MIERLGQSLFLPTILFGFAFFAASNENKLPGDARILIAYLPYASLLLVAVIAGAFNRGRSFLTTVLALLILLGEQQSATIHHLQSSMLLLIPLNVALITWLPERGALTASGTLRSIFILIQAAAVVYASHTYSQTIEPILYFNVLPVWHEHLQSSQVAAIASLFALFVGLGASYFTPSPINQSLFGANVGLTAVLLFNFPPATDNIFMFTIALVLSIGLLRDYYNMAYRDELTGLPQRRALNENMTALGGRYCLAMLDVDHFKKFNDTHGHDIGDQVLQMVASRINKVQGGGKAYRYGGEEFTIVFNNKTVDDAVYFLEEVRKSIQDYEMVIRGEERPDQEDKTQKKSRKKGSFRTADKKVSVTISIGAAERTKGEQPDDVLKRADQALYQAKKSGRNRVAS